LEDFRVEQRVFNNVQRVGSGLDFVEFEFLLFVGDELLSSLQLVAFVNVISIIKEVQLQVLPAPALLLEGCDVQYFLHCGQQSVVPVAGLEVLSPLQFQKVLVLLVADVLLLGTLFDDGESALDLLGQIGFVFLFLVSPAREHFLLEAEGLDVLLGFFEFLVLLEQAVSEDLGFSVQRLLGVEQGVLRLGLFHNGGLELTHGLFVLADDVLNVLDGLHGVLLLAGRAQFLLELVEFVLARVDVLVDGFDLVLDFG